VAPRLTKKVGIAPINILFTNTFIGAIIVSIDKLHMIEALDGEIIERKFEGIDHQLQDAADILEGLLKDFDSFPATGEYTYENGTVSFDISMLSEDERDEIIQRTNASEALQNLFTTALGTKVADNGAELVFLLLEKK
jgi:hypothetical protein